MSREQPKLHEAMRMILLDQPDRTAEYLYLARENRRRDLYRRPKDGEHPAAAQIRARARQYEPRGWFKCLGGGSARLARGGVAAGAASSARRPERA